MRWGASEERESQDDLEVVSVDLDLFEVSRYDTRRRRDPR